MITYIHTKSCTQILITALFVTVKKSGYNSNTLMNEQNMTSPFNGILFDLEKKWSTDTCCYNMDESWKYYANWKKSLSKDDTVYSFIYTKYAKQGNLRDRRRLDIAFGWCKNNVRGKWGVTATLYRYFLRGDKIIHREGNGTPLQYSCLENPMDGGAWWAVVHGVAKSQARLSDFTFTFHFHALEKEMATHSSVLAWRSQGRGSQVGCRLWGRTESDTTEVT